MKLFISYARVDKPLCKQVVQHLSEVHEVWYDRRLHAGQRWWDEIVRRLDWCDGFVYLLSPESVQSQYCQREFVLATEAEKHIFPVLIQARTAIPGSLSQIHYADLSEGMEDIITLMNALTVAERQQRAPRPVPPPPVPALPDKPPADIAPNLAVAQAADAMEAENFDDAVFVIKQALDKKPKGRMGRILQAMLGEAETALEQQAYLREAEREYAPIAELVKRSATRKLGCAEFADFQQQFPDYDPDNIVATCAEPVAPPVSPCPEEEGANQILVEVRAIVPPPPFILPPPFKWIEIPTGQVEIKDGYGIFDVPAFLIAKYPVTNAQYAEFIEAGGYQDQQWWTDAGWQVCREGWHYDSGWKPSGNPWTAPRFWLDEQWNGADYPVVGVSWFEALAFCRWLGAASGASILLPTEQQWQRAAQGDDDHVFPWGDAWDGARCNNSVSPYDSNQTTLVQWYEGPGDSPFGVVDMSGNVWEWCLTQYESGSHDLEGGIDVLRVLRGGSWDYKKPDDFCASCRDLRSPTNGGVTVGFRCACDYDTP